MKKLYLLLAITLLNHHFSVGQNQWQWLNPKPSGFACLSIAFFDHQNGFILNTNGDLIRTTDQGTSWTEVANIPGATALAIANSTGVVTTKAGGIYLSTDNGNSWNPIQTGMYTDPSQNGVYNPLKFISIVSRDSFFVSRSLDSLYATSDRGKTWTAHYLSPGMTCMSFVNSRIGFLGTGDGGVAKTIDGGTTWQLYKQVNLSSAYVDAIQFLNADTGYIHRWSDSIEVSYDGGITWLDRAFIPDAFNCIDFVNSSLGFFGGSGGAIYRVTDSGSIATSVTRPGGFKGGYDINAICFLSPDTGFAVGLLGQILKTTDSGSTWKPYSPIYTPISSAVFGSPSTGYAASEAYLYKTTDSGRTWDTLSLNTGTAYYNQSQFRVAHFTSADTGFVVQDQNVLVHTTTNGGLTWDTIYPAAINGYDYVESAFFPNPQTNYICLAGTNSAIAKSTDNGNTWNPLYPLNGAIYSNFFIVDSTTAFATSYGNLLRSADGMQTWYPVFQNSLNYFFTGIWFINAQKGFLTDEQSEIFVTNDGGNSWTLLPFTGGYNYDTFHSIVKFFNSEVGYMTNGDATAGGAYGATFMTFDGGANWQLSYPAGGGSIEFTADSNVIISGYGGTILRAPVKGGKIDSFTLAANGFCGATLSAGVGAALGTVDSIRFVITGSNGKTISVTASPASVTNARSICTATVTDLSAGLTYTAQLAFRFNGSDVLSDSIRFVAQSAPTPLIRDSSGILISTTASGNQWYFDGNPISGAIQQYLRPKAAGNYTVQTSQDSCVSAMSPPYTFHSAALGLVVAPNPTYDDLNLLNTQNRSLLIRILDLTGQTLITTSIYSSSQSLDVARLATGEYILNVTDINTHQTGNLLFLKL